VSAALLPFVRLLALVAGDAALAHAADPEARAKADGSPVTRADEAADAVLVSGLRHLAPDIPVVSEEQATHAVPGRRFWLVDPLDGTREFLAGNGEWTVNVALVEDNRPVLGVVVAPALGLAYEGAGPGTAALTERGATRPIRARTPDPDGLVVVGSRSHNDAAAMERFLAGRRVRAYRAAGSSLKLCLLAAGEADLYPRLGPTMEWDIAAGHAVLLAAGGTVATLDGAPLAYGKPGFGHDPFVATGAPP
jgi:3'(2'), 5'-bisphosphate nucleotidase